MSRPLCMICGKKIKRDSDGYGIHDSYDEYLGSIHKSHCKYFIKLDKRYNTIQKDLKKAKG